MALVLNVKNKNDIEYDLYVNFNSVSKDILAPPRPPLIPSDPSDGSPPDFLKTGAFDAALLQYQPTAESGIQTTPNGEDDLLNDRYFRKNFNIADSESRDLKKFYIPLNFDNDNDEITITPTLTDISHCVLSYTNSDGVDQEVKFHSSESPTSVQIPHRNGYVRPSLAISRGTQRLTGDVNDDGVVNVLDAYAIVQHMLKVQLLSGDNLVAADVNEDGSVDVLDAYAIVQHMLGVQLLT